MEPKLLQCLARSRVQDLVHDAECMRLLRVGRPRARPSFRGFLARAIREIGYVALSLGDAIAESR